MENRGSIIFGFARRAHMKGKITNERRSWLKHNSGLITS